MPAESPSRALQQYQAYLECLTYIQIDPRLWRRFGWSDVVNHTLLEAHKELQMLEALPEPDRNRRLRRMLMNNLLEKIEEARAGMRDYRREVGLDEALTGSSCNLQKWLAADSLSPSEKLEAVERGAQLAEALMTLPVREREALILQKYHDWTLAQVADQLGCTTGAVAGLHARALTHLRERLAASGDEME